MNFYRSIPVGRYHHVNDNEQDYITVSTAHFEDQMRMLAEKKFRTLSAAEFRECKLGLMPVPERAVLLTFDDAWLDVYAKAFPIMKHYGHRFTVFVISEWTRKASEKPPAVTPGSFPLHNDAKTRVAGGRAGEVICGWSHLQEMLASGLCSVENHTANHDTQHFAEDRARLTEQIGLCQESLKKHLGVESRQLCWPHGNHSETGLQAAADLGIDVTYLVKAGINMPLGDAMEIKRFRVDDFNAATLEKWLRLYSSPLRGYLYVRLKLEKRLKKLKSIGF